MRETAENANDEDYDPHQKRPAKRRKSGPIKKQRLNSDGARRLSEKHVHEQLEDIDERDSDEERSIPKETTPVTGQLGKTRANQPRIRTDSDPPPRDYFRITDYPLLPRPMGPLLEIFQTEGRGRGVRTTQDNIPKGTVLYNEAATVRRPKYRGDSEEEDANFVKRIRASVVELTPEVRTAFMALSHADGEDTEEGRFARNCFEDRDIVVMDESSEEQIDGIFTLWLDIAMINHSCRPNVVMLIREPVDSAKMPTADLIATTDIPAKGTEITISYLRGAEVGCKELMRDERQDLLLNGWDFTCICEACDDPSLRQPDTPTDGMDSPSRSSSPLSEPHETADDRLHCIHQLGQDLGLIEYAEDSFHPLRVERFDALFPQYEALLEAERMIYPLYDAHTKAIEAYSRRYASLETNDELIYARILYHRERLLLYTRICWGNEEAQRCAAKYIKDLKGNITVPKGSRETVHASESTSGVANGKKRLLKAAVAKPSQMKALTSQVIILDDSEDDGDDNGDEAEGEEGELEPKRRKVVPTKADRTLARPSRPAESSRMAPPPPPPPPRRRPQTQHPQPSQHRPFKERAHKSTTRKALSSRIPGRTAHHGRMQPHANAPQRRRSLMGTGHAPRKVMRAPPIDDQERRQIRGTQEGHVRAPQEGRVRAPQPGHAQVWQSSGVVSKVRKAPAVYGGSGKSLEDPIELDD